MEQGRADRLGVEAHARADLRDADRVRDEALPGFALLVGVALAGEAECLRDPLLVDRLNRVVGVLLDQREQVDQELAFLLRETLGELGVGGPLRAVVLDYADAHMRIGQPLSVVGAVPGYAAC